MSKRFICPEAEGYDQNGAKRLILTELFEIRDNINTDKLITQYGLKTLFFEDVIRKNDQRRGVFGFDSMLRYLDFFNIPAELKTIAQIASATGAVIASNFTDTSNWFWRFRSLSELYALPYWFTVFLEDSIAFIQPVRGTGSVYRGTVTANNLIGSSRQVKTGILFTGETGAVIKNFPDVKIIVPETLDAARKRMFDNKSKSVADTITFSSGEGFYAEPGDWVRYEDPYIVVSRRENNGSPVYTAVREVTDNPTYATADIPFAQIVTALNAAFLNGKTESELVVADSAHADDADTLGGKTEAQLVVAGAGAVDGYGIDNTGFANGEMVQIDETGKELEHRPSGMFRARLTNTFTITTGGTYYTLPLATEDFDLSGWWDAATNYRFTPQKAGKYEIYAQARLTAAITDGKELIIAIYKNNGAVAYSWCAQSGAGSYPLAQIRMIVDFNGSTDYIDIRVTTSAAENGKIVSNTASHTYAEGHRVA